MEEILNEPVSQAFPDLKTEREALLTQASEPSLLVQTVTSLVRSAAGRTAAEVGSGAEPRVDVERVERRDLERPGGRRFGALVHARIDRSQGRRSSS